MAAGSFWINCIDANVVGVDPGNKACGVVRLFGSVARWYYGSPWDLIKEDQLLEYEPAVVGSVGTRLCPVYVEVPQNGTHNSRGGVHWAGGILARTLCVKEPNHLRKVQPRAWRTVWESFPFAEGLDEKEKGKAFALHFLPLLPKDAPSDLYDAACIALYGLETELRKQRSKTVRGLSVTIDTNDQKKG